MGRYGVDLGGDHVVEVRYVPGDIRSFTAVEQAHSGRAELEMVTPKKKTLVAIEGNVIPDSKEVFLEQMLWLPEGADGGGYEDVRRFCFAEAVAAYQMALSGLGFERIDAEIDRKIGAMLTRTLGWKHMPGKESRLGFYRIDLTQGMPMPSILVGKARHLQKLEALSD